MHRFPVCLTQHQRAFRVLALAASSDVDRRGCCSRDTGCLIAHDETLSLRADPMGTAYLSAGGRRRFLLTMPVVGTADDRSRKRKHVVWGDQDDEKVCGPCAYPEWGHADYCCMPTKAGLLCIGIDGPTLLECLEHIETRRKCRGTPGAPDLRTCLLHCDGGSHMLCTG